MLLLSAPQQRPQRIKARRIAQRTQRGEDFLRCLGSDRLRRAIEVLRADPPELVQGDYVELLPEVLAQRDPDALTLVFQIASTPYVAEEGRRRIYAALNDAGRSGSLAFLNATRAAEGWEDDGYGLEVQAWPAARRHVGHMDFHGEWVAWQG